MNASRFLISGRVQGVGFRAATQTRARELGLDGWVRNLRDGRVEALIAGAPAALQAMRDWLGEGPAFAVVERVEESPAEAPQRPGFRLAATPVDYP